MLGIVTTFVRPFRSPLRLLVGLLLSLVPILNVATIGFAVQLLRPGAAGDNIGLPEWKNWRRLFVDGVVFVIVTTVYLAPLYLITGLRERISPDALAPDSGVGPYGWIILTVLTIGYGLVPVAMISYVRDGFFSIFAIHKVVSRALSLRLILRVMAWIVLFYTFLVVGIILAPAGWIVLAPTGFIFSVLGLGLFAGGQSADEGREGRQ